MHLYVVRHAIAFEHDASRWPNDADRPLTAEGEARFRRAARGLRVLAPTVEIVLASPFARAWRTAQILAEEAGWPEPVPCKELQAERPVADAVRAVRRHPDVSSAAVVGHEPNLGGLASALLTGSEDLVRFDLKKGGVVALELEAGAVRPGRAFLRWALMPKALRALAR
jgi:phosphohistidine phosphatase